MKKQTLIFFILVVTFIANGCSVLASREAAAGCQVADIASTEYALHHNPNAIEENNLAPLPILFLIKLAIAYFIMTTDTWDDIHPGVRAAITIIGCAPVPGNLHVARQKP